MIASMGESTASVEPADGHTHETRCLNCAARLDGPYCHQCGQRAHVHRTLHAFFHDFLHGVLHFEGKVWHTLPLLAWRPGELTRRYIDGERARFVSPIALFLFSVFLVFAVLSLGGGTNSSFADQSDLAVQQQQAETQLARKRAERAKLAPGDLKAAELEREIRETTSEVETIRLLRERGVTSAVFDRSTIQTDLPFVKEAFAKARKNPDLLLYKLKSNIYKFSWAIIPLSAPFLWLLFPLNRRFRMYDHVVFVTYSLSFMTLLVVAGALLGMAGVGGAAAFLVLVPPVHMYRQLRGAYGVGGWVAACRTALLLIFSLVVLLAFVLMMAGLGVLD
jgi:hypothetical protein